MPWAMQDVGCTCQLVDSRCKLLHCQETGVVCSAQRKAVCFGSVTMVLHIAGSACCLGFVTLLFMESCRPQEAAFCVSLMT